MNFCPINFILYLGLRLQPAPQFMIPLANCQGPTLPLDFAVISPANKLRARIGSPFRTDVYGFWMSIVADWVILNSSINV
jgi:hypothetical protein